MDQDKRDEEVKEDVDKKIEEIVAEVREQAVKTWSYNTLPTLAEESFRAFLLDAAVEVSRLASGSSPTDGVEWVDRVENPRFTPWATLLTLHYGSCIRDACAGAIDRSVLETLGETVKLCLEGVKFAEVGSLRLITNRKDSYHGPLELAYISKGEK